MAQMSKDLATICITCPVEFRYEDAAIDNLYTSEAYQYMKRLEFKSILSRFDAVAIGSQEEKGIEEYFTLISDKKEAVKAFKKAEKASALGMQLILGSTDALREEEPIQLSFSFDESGQVKTGKKARKGQRVVAGLALCAGEKDIWCIRCGEGISQEELLEAVDRLSAPTERPVWVLDLKAMLPYVDWEDKENVFDAGVAGYLLNPGI